MDMNFSKLWKIVKDKAASHAAVHGSQRAGHNLATEEQLACVLFCFVLFFAGMLFQGNKAESYLHSQQE